MQSDIFGAVILNQNNTVLYEIFIHIKLVHNQNNIKVSL